MGSGTGREGTISPRMDLIEVVVYLGGVSILLFL